MWLALILRELKTRFGGHLIGLFWLLLEPLVHIAVMLGLKVVLRERYVGVMIEPAVYLVVAMLPFFASRNIWMQGMSAVEANGGLLAYRQVKPLDAMFSRWAMEGILYAFIFVLLSMGFAWWGYRYFPQQPLEYLFIWALFIVWGIALSLICAVIGHRRPGVKFFVRAISFPLYMLSGVLIPLSSFPPSMYEYLLWNPFLHLVELCRVHYFSTYVAHRGVNLEYPLYWGLSLLFVGAVLYHVNRVRLLSKTT
ncbi:MAG: ABC transporter permease [Ideonella sp.]|nr:ABC transporter permease [Ideonella sp.]